MPRAPILLLLPTLLVLRAPPLAAQTPGRAPAVLEVPASTRAMGTGGAYPLGDADSDVLFYNPALLGSAAGSLMAGVHDFGGEGLGLTVSAAREGLGGSVGVGLRTLQHGVAGGGPPAGGVDPLVSAGSEGVSETVAGLGFARRLLGLRVGVAGRVVSQRRPDLRQVTGSVDVGVAHDVGPLTAGLVVAHLGPGADAASDVHLPQPRRITLGVGGYGREVGPLDVGLAAAVTLRDDDEIVAGGGLEVGYWPVVGRTFIVRAGVGRVPEGSALPLTLGASYRGDDLVLAWAYQGVEDRDGVHRFSVGWR